MLKVGEPFEGKPKRYAEGTHYNYGVGGHALTGFFHDPQPEEIADWRKGKPEFAFAVVEGLFFFLSKFGNQPWSDSPYRWHTVPEDRRDLPTADLNDGKSMLIHCVLCDARNGKVQAIRVISPNTEFMRAVHEEIRRQSEVEIDLKKYEVLLNKVMAIYDTKQLVARAVTRST